MRTTADIPFWLASGGRAGVDECYGTTFDFIRAELRLKR